VGLRAYGINRDLIEQVIILGSVFIAAVIIVPLLEFAWNFVRAPILIKRDELAEAREALRKTQLRNAELEMRDKQIQEMLRNRGDDLIFQPEIVTKNFLIGDKRRRGIVAQIKITNNPRLHNGLVIGSAVTVVPELTFSDAHIAVFRIPVAFSIEGRWGDSEDPKAPDDPVLAITIKPGESRILDVGIKLDADWYAINNRSFFWGYQVPSYKLSSRGFRMHVRIKGDVVDVTKIYEVRESGVDWVFKKL
jgi:hypothetical protein